MARAYKTCFSLVLATLVATSVIFSTLPAAAQGDRMVLDHIDLKKYSKEGRLRFYLDILDRKNRVIPEQEKKNLKFFVNDDEIAGDSIKSVDMNLFRDIGEPIAVGILFTNYRGYVPKSAGETNLFSFAKTGVIEFLKELKQNFDWVGIWLYNEEDFDNKVPFKTNIEEAIEVVKDMDETALVDIDDEGDDDGKTSTPPFYRRFDSVVRKMSELDDLPRRRILLVISDGVGEFNDRQKDRIDNKVRRIVETANDASIKVYAFGAFLQEDAFLTYLSRAAERTYGVYVKVAPERPEDLESRLRDLAPQLKKQYVVDLFAEDLPEDEKVKFKVEAETPSGEKISTVYPRQIKLPETPTNWTSILKWIGGILAMIFGLAFFVWLIKKIIEWRGNRPQEEVIYREEYVGPDRGKLRVLTGPMAGEVFPLTEEIVTIGSVDGNHVVIHDDGVSKRHAGIKIEDMRYELADFGSTNGTWVNGRKINKQFLRDNDEIRVGNTTLEFTLK